MMADLRAIHLVLACIVVFAMQACVRIDIGGRGSPEPSPTPPIPSIPVPSSLTSVSLGPAIVEGMYCWTDYPSGERYMKLAVYNPGDSSLRILADPYGSFSARPHEVALTDNLRISEGSACEYSLALDRNDEGNEHLSQNYGVEFSGVTLHSPVAEALLLVNRYFSDLEAGNIKSLRQYVGSDTSAQTLASLIAWRTRIAPVETSVESCRPRFTYDPQQAASFVAPTWACKVNLVYSTLSPSPGSGTWRGQVLGYPSQGSLKLIAD